MKKQTEKGGDQNRETSNLADDRRQSQYDFSYSQNYDKKESSSHSDQSNLWQSILNEVAQRDDVKDSHLIVLGDRGAGKRSILSTLNKTYIRATNKFIDVDKMGSQYAGLDFQFIYVKDLTEKDALTTIVTSDENLPRMNAWIIQEVEMVDMVKLALKPEDLQHTCALIVLDFDQPWEMMNSLQKWVGALGENILELMRLLPLSIQDQMKEKVAKYVKNYERKEGDEQNKQQKQKTNTAEEENKDGNTLDDEDDYSDLKNKLPLPEGVLKVNLGIPIIVVCHKVDLLIRGDKASYLEQHLEFIQKNLRSYCLSYAATILFTEIHQQTNLELLYRYLLHRLYEFDFNIQAQGHSKETIFLPTGYDSLLLIDALCKGGFHENKIFEEVIKKPAQAQQIQMRPDVVCEDWHIILNKQHGIRRLVHSGSGPQPSAGGITSSQSKTVQNQPQNIDEDKRNKMKGFYETLMKNNTRNQGAAGGSVNAPSANQEKKNGDTKQLSSNKLEVNGVLNNNPSQKGSDVLQQLKEKHSKLTLNVEQIEKDEDEHQQQEQQQQKKQQIVNEESSNGGQVESEQS